jgi:Tc5 transposase DNA-binding domain
VSRHEAKSVAQILSPDEEAVLLEWSTLSATSAKPMSGTSLRGQALAISGKLPGKHWHRRFIRRHPSLVLGKSNGLDPKRAKNFNKTVVADYFEKRKILNDKYDGIPPEQDWNMDEKGLQMGGGRKNSGWKFIFTRTTKDRYRIRSDNLELVTVIECISAAGDSVPPSFVLSDGRLPDVRDLPDNSVSQ